MKISANRKRSNEFDLGGRFAVPIEVRLRIAEIKKQMADSRYQVMVRRAQSLAEMRCYTAWPERTDSDL